MSSTLDPHQKAACQHLLDDLRACFGHRLAALVAYGPGVFHVPAHRSGRVPLNTLALVDAVGLADLESMARHAERWDRSGLAMPLVLGRDEFSRSLDAFPVEFGNIIAHHVVLAGDDPFEDLAVRKADLRRTCEALAKSHLIHLREAYLETRGRPADLATVIRDSARPLAAFLGALAVLVGEDVEGPAPLADLAERLAGVPGAVVRHVLESIYAQTLSNDEARRLYPDYLTAVERLVTYVDRLDG
jgi:hypothetical protein